MPRSTEDLERMTNEELVPLQASLKAGRELAGNDQNRPNKPAQGKIAPDYDILAQISARFLLPSTGENHYGQKPATPGFIRSFVYVLKSNASPLDNQPNPREVKND